MLYSKEIKHCENFDVVVIGGGVAGFCAAVASARAGASTALIEDQGALGGILTTGGNPQIGIFYAFKKQIISGIGWELCKRLEQKGFAQIPDFSVVDTAKGGKPSNVKVNRAMTEAEMNNMCIEAGVNLFFRTKVIDAIVKNGRVQSVIAAEKGGIVSLSAKVFIDSTGDGDVAYLCGADYEKPDELQPGTFGYAFKCNNLDELDEDKLRAAFNDRKSKGLLEHGDYWPEYHAKLKGFLGAGGDNTNHIIMDGSDPISITNAEIEGRKRMERLLSFAVSEADVEIYPPANYVAPRETRRIMCDYKVTMNDFITGRLFNDSLAYAYYGIDLHSVKLNNEGKPFEEEQVLVERTYGIVPTIPYRAMTVKGFSNLFVAGRCISTEREVMGAFRVKAPCMAMGEAVGVAAAFSPEGIVRDVDIEKVKKSLTQNGAIVPSEQLFKSLV